MDELELRCELDIATCEALAEADRLVDVVLSRPLDNVRVARLARAYDEKRRYMAQLRQALKVEVAG